MDAAKLTEYALRNKRASKKRHQLGPGLEYNLHRHALVTYDGDSVTLAGLCMGSDMLDGEVCIDVDQESELNWHVWS